MSVLKIAEVDFFEDKSVDINEYIKEYKDWIENSNLLNDKTFKYNITSDKTFESDKWILFDNITQGYYVIDFTPLEDMIKRKVFTLNYLNILKCWIVSRLQEEYSIILVKKSYAFVKNVIELSNNFNPDTVNKSNGNEFLNKIESTKEISALTGLKDYLCFLDELDMASDFMLDCLNHIENINIEYEKKSRRIPYSKDIIAFKYYLDKFYNGEYPTVLKNFYMPILLWWKITSVIPMRPSEFSFKLKRDCVFIEGENYYLKIDRVKIKNKSNNGGKIPLLNKVQITKSIYDLIVSYIDITSFDTDSTTLISYNALKYFEKESSKLDLDIKVLWNGIKKSDTTSFNRMVLQRLLDSFYEVVIKGIYKDNNITAQLKIGDTRHLAFSSLVMQGLNPIEIAMLGGHRHLHSQDSYAGHVEYYIDSEILDFVSNRNIEKSISDKNLLKLIYSKSTVCPRFVADCYPTEEGIGYCTLDINSDNSLCDEVEICMFCSKWWCEPSNENYIKAKNFLESNVMSELKRTIEKEEDFLIQLLSNAKTINIDGLLELDKDYEEQVDIARLRLKSSVDKMIFLKQSLLNYNNENNMIGDE